MIIKQIELAKKIGVSRQAISKLKKEGKLIFNEDGKFDTEVDANANYIICKNFNPKNLEPLDYSAESGKLATGEKKAGKILKGSQEKTKTKKKTIRILMIWILSLFLAFPKNIKISRCNKL